MCFVYLQDSSAADLGVQITMTTAQLKGKPSFSFPSVNGGSIF